jgi:hypothetical protein
MRKYLKIAGIVFGVFLLWGIFNLFMGNGSSISKQSLQSKSFSGKGISDGMDMMETSSRNLGMSSPEMMMAEDSAGSAPESPVPADKKVIKNGNLSLKIEKTEKAVEEISEITKNQGGEVFSTNFYERVKGQKSGSMTIKVPVEKFEETISKIKSVATQVISESTSGQDVTEQYADLQIQVKNKKAEEESFVKILERAGKIEDVLAVTTQIARVRGEIERLEGRIRVMNSQTDMSTIVVSLSEDIEITPISNDWRPWQVVKKSFGELIDSMQGFVDGAIHFVIVTLPSFVIFLLIAWIVWIGGKKIYEKVINKK